MTNFKVPSQSEILQSALNNYNSLADYFNQNLVITPTDEPYIRLNTYASVTSVLYQYMVQLVYSKILYTATNTDLDEVANILGFTRRTATASQGAVQLVSSSPQFFPTTTLLTGPNGITFNVRTAGTYSNGQNVIIVSNLPTNVGSQTNLDTGSIFTWQTPTSTMQATCLCSVACTGGVDPEDDESFRNRIYLSIQAPPGMGNASQIITVASSVDNLIQQSFVYANFNGSGTELIVLAGYQTNSYIGRDIPHLQYDGFVTIYGQQLFNPNLINQVGGFGAFNQYTLAANNLGPNLSAASSALSSQVAATVANPFATTTCTVNNLPADVAAVLTLPYPAGSFVNSNNGGWLQSMPFPVPDGFYVSNFCAVTAVTNSTTITISAPSSGTYNTTNPNIPFTTYNAHVPVQGQSQIQWINRSDANQNGWQVVTATILTAVDNGNQTWTLTLDTPFVFPSNTTDFYGNTGVAVGDFIFPASANGQTYLNNIMASFALMGPGEVTSDQGLDALGAARYPGSNTQFPNQLAGPAEQLLKSNNEVYAAQLNPGTGVVVLGKTYFNCYNVASVPPPNNAPPNIWVPRNIAFYPSEFYNFGE